MTNTQAAERNMTTIRNLFDEVVNNGRIDLCDRYLAENRIDHENYGMPEGTSSGHEGFRTVLGAFTAAFPDLHLSIKFMVADGTKLVVYLKTTGTHLGSFMGAPPTGKSFSASGVDIFAFNEEGKVSEHWGAFDTLGVMVQLGLIPTPSMRAAA